MKTSTLIRKSLREIQLIHEKLGDDYLAHCDASGVEPLPVVWSTCPPCIHGVTTAMILLDDERDFQIDASREEISHAVFIRVMTLRLAQAN